METILVVDVQNGLMKASNAYLVRNINRLLEQNQFEHVFYTQFHNTLSSPFVSGLDWHEMMDSESQKIAVNLLKNAVVWKKQTYGLPQHCLSTLKSLKLTQIYLCGTDIDACLLSIAFQLFDCGIQPLFVWDCCDTSAKQFMLKELSAEIIKRSFGASSITHSKKVKGTT